MDWRDRILANDESWYGFYMSKNGRILHMDDSYDFDDVDMEEENIIGAVNYNFLDDEGFELDGGWFGYDEETAVRDVMEFMAGANKDSGVQPLLRKGEFGYEQVEAEVGSTNFMHFLKLTVAYNAIV